MNPIKIGECKQGNISSVTQVNTVESLYKDHSPWLLGWLNKKLSCPHHAADLTHDTFVRLLKNEEQVTSIRDPRSFLTKVAKGLLIDRWRRSEIERTYMQALARLPEVVAVSSEDREEALETLVQISKVLDSLPKKTKEAFLLSRFDGLTYSQIAVKLNISVSSVRKYIFKATTRCIAISDSFNS